MFSGIPVTTQEGSMDQQQPAKMKDLSTYNTEEKEAVEVAKLISHACLP